MRLSHNVSAGAVILSVEKLGRAWIDARAAVAAAEQRMELARKRKDDALREFGALIERFPASVPGALDRLQKAISASLDDAARAEREAGSEEVPMPFKPVDDSAVAAFDDAVAPYMNPLADIIDAEREVDDAGAELGEKRRAERVAFAAFRDVSVRAAGGVHEMLWAVDEIKARSEQESAAARKFLADCERLRGRVQGED